MTAGGRVLGAVGLGDSLAAARQAAYELLDGIHFEGLTLPARHRRTHGSRNMADSKPTTRRGVAWW